MSIPLTECFEHMNLGNALQPMHPSSQHPIHSHTQHPIHSHTPHPIQIHHCLHAKLKIFNETAEWHRENIKNGKPISINMLFLISLIEPIHKLYKIDNNSIINWCFRDIYLAIFGTQTLPLSETETNMNNMYKNFYYKVMDY